MVDRAILRGLEQRLAKGEQYLEQASIPDRKEATALYYRLTAEYVSLCESAERARDIKAVWLDLAPGCAYQRQGSALTHTTVKVLFQGEPRDSMDIALEGLRELLQTTKIVREATG
ncbi:MAG: hypothetical protein Q7K03_10650 [Dehalococcoidia bacterium]|nr:hypothetical protein [Dehalococcoidia bacterium]